MEYITTNIVIAVIFRTIVSGENMRWVRARLQGMRGASVSFGLFVDWVLIIGQSLWYLFLVAFAFDTSIFSSVILFIVALLTAAVSGLIIKDNTVVWMISTILVLPLSLYLLFQTTIFGLV